MESLDCKECQVHVLVCNNERPPEKACCAEVGGREFYQAIKNKMKESGLYNTHWVTRTGCLGHCNRIGCTVVIYRKNEEPRWYSKVKYSDFDFIWSEITLPMKNEK